MASRLQLERIVEVRRLDEDRNFYNTHSVDEGVARLAEEMTPITRATIQVTRSITFTDYEIGALTCVLRDVVASLRVGTVLSDILNKLQSKEEMGSIGNDRSQGDSLMPARAKDSFPLTYAVSLLVERNLSTHAPDWLQGEEERELYRELIGVFERYCGTDPLEWPTRQYSFLNVDQFVIDTLKSQRDNFIGLSGGKKAT